jgi:hypothetical protein
MSDTAYDDWHERMESDRYSQSHEARMERLHDVSLRRLGCNDLGPAECTCTSTHYEPRGTSGDWAKWESELTDREHNALLDAFVRV